MIERNECDADGRDVAQGEKSAFCAPFCGQIPEDQNTRSDLDLWSVMFEYTEKKCLLEF